MDGNSIALQFLCYAAGVALLLWPFVSIVKIVVGMKK